MENRLETVDSFVEMQGYDVYSYDDEKIGSVEEVYYDEATRRPEWIGIGTGFLGMKRVLVPVDGAQVDGDKLRVRFSKDQVKDSPDIDGDEISVDTERELASYYGISYSTDQSETGLPGGTSGMTGAPAAMPTGTQTNVTADRDASVVRSEEELRIGKREVEAGSARLRKWVETVPVSEQVELRRETAYVQREPINQPVSGTEIGEREVEVKLTEEQPVVL